MIIHLIGLVNADMIDNLVNAYNKLEFLPDTGSEKLDIIFSSEGGENGCASLIIDLINSNKDITTLTGYNQLFSNGFKIFFECKCEKKLTQNITGMYHLYSFSGVTQYEGLTEMGDSYLSFMKKKSKNFDYLNSVDKLVNFTEQELELIKNNEDAWFDYKRLSQMLKYSMKNE